MKSYYTRALVRIKKVVKPLLIQRRFHAFCIGGAKTGTHSIANIFRKSYRADHEPTVVDVIDMIVAAGQKKSTATEVDRWLAKRDRSLWLEMESSHFTAVFTAQLVRQFPTAKFILTVRDCRSWLRSAIAGLTGTVQSYAAKHYWITGKYIAAWPYVTLPSTNLLNEVPDLQPAMDSLQELKTSNRTSETLVDILLGQWRIDIQRALEYVPPERMLIVRTDQISSRLADMAAFVGVPLTTLNAEKTHAFKRFKRNDVDELSAFDPEFLRTRFRQHCTPYMERFFPEIEL